ncbi:MAG: trimethylamine methyltransferase family protein [Chloroflexi bacterium]|nr:trimethylamine methyltransferase family protein [Chloroflexota bacterium]
MFQNVLAFPQLQMLSREQCETVHRASLEILRRTGVRVYHDGALALLRETDAIINDDNLVRLPPGLIEWALAQAPSRLALCQRGGDQVIAPLEGQRVSFGSGSDCPNYLDPRTGDRRPFTSADVVECIHVVDALPELAFCMSMGIPSELATSNAYRQQFALMIEHTSKPIVFVCDDVADCEASTAMASAAAGGIEQLRINPTLLLYSEPSTPLKHSETATGKLLYMAEQRLPIVHSPAPMMGGTAPVTLAAGLALGNAEVLSSLVMHQLKHPGAPFVYGSGLHHMDMRTTISVYGAPEFQLARVAVMEMGRYYDLPTWGYAGHSDSCVMDEQAASDATFSVLIALLTGTNLAHDVGYLEAGLTTSPELMVFTAEIIAMMRRFMGGMSLDAEALALDVIHQAGPGGDFLTAKHTRNHFREHWQPKLFTRQRLAEWAAEGSQRLGDRLREKTIGIIESHQPAPLPDNVRAEIAYILKTGPAARL